MDELAMNLTSKRVDDRYLKVFIVAQAVVAEVLSKLFAVLDGLQIAFEVDPDPVSHRDAILHVEKELLHCLPQIASTIENHPREATIGKGLPRFRALAQMTVMERSSKPAVLAADVPSSTISAISCAVWAAVQFGWTCTPL
jgi:hypothetical protein